MIHLVIVSGLSGSGKSIALQTLEDEGYYCVDNLPINFLETFLDKMAESHTLNKLAIGLDIRGFAEEIEEAALFLESIKENASYETKIVFLQATNEVLLKRYDTTRRKHPLANKKQALLDAISYERTFLDPIFKTADRTIDTSFLNVHELREIFITEILGDKKHLYIQVLSFGFKNGLPLDADFMFDVRALPNPHWRDDLRKLTGLNQPVIDFFTKEPEVLSYLKDLDYFFSKWIPLFEKGTRTYLSIAIGCTGGQHRSVFLAERLYNSLKEKAYMVTVKHRELGL